MGLKKQIYYGFSGYKAPVIPRAPRSSRKRGPRKKIIEDSKVSAFEILATVAGKLLEETESSSASSNAAAVTNQPSRTDMIKEEREDCDNLVKAECIHQGRREEEFFISGISPRDCNHSFTSKEFPHGKSDAILECVSIITSLNYPEKINSDVKLANVKRRNVSGCGEIANKISKVSLDHRGPCYGSNIRQSVSDRDKTRDLTAANACNSIPAIANLDRKVELPSCKHPIPGACFDRNRNDVKLGSKDDDESFSQCHKPGTKTKVSRPLPRIGDRRIRKLLKSKYWKVAPKLKTCEASNACGLKRKTFYNQKRSQSDNFLKRRKLLDQSSVVNSDGVSSVESFANSSQMSMYRDKNASTAALQGVKLSITSFMVPELFIEIPESATVGLLKRTVMEAVSAMLESSLHIGVLLRGKKIRDDNTTLLQTGISHNDNLDALGFSLEPSAAEAPLLSSHEDPPFSLPCDSPRPLIRSSATPVSDTRFSDVSPDLSLLNTVGNDDHNHLSSPTNILTDDTVPDSKALVAVPPMSVGTLPLTPVSQKSKRSEFTQRRTRRPFSVTEVEALVHAVEELGTGRWRDVKLRAFDDANHRTYVDLKDKWKTLVHTAKISPQQRRGEPVPQQLLDRVLRAHAYWTRHHDKQHGKHQSGTLAITEGPVDGIEA